MSSLPTLYIVLTIILTAVSQLLQKQAAEDMNRADGYGALLSNINFILSGTFLGASVITWLLVLKYVDVSVAYPMLSLNYVLVLVLAKLFFGESIPSRRWVGVLSIIAGVSVLSVAA